MSEETIETSTDDEANAEAAAIAAWEEREANLGEHHSFDTRPVR